MKKKKEKKIKIVLINKLQVIKVNIKKFLNLIKLNKKLIN